MAKNVVVHLYPGPPNTAISGIKVEQGKKDKRFTVTYGLQVKSGLGYSAACTELGQCLMHHLACEGLIDQEGPD